MVLGTTPGGDVTIQRVVCDRRRLHSYGEIFHDDMSNAVYYRYGV